MKKIFLCIALLLILLAGLWTAKSIAEQAAEKTLASQTPEPRVTEPERTDWVQETSAAPETMPTEASEAVAETAVPTEPVPVLTFTEEEETLLLKLAASERGDTGCPYCMALVMRTVLNRVESPKFSATIKGVIYAQDQFTPVMDGTFEKTEPDWLSRKALDMVKEGWDESQGALYYEWCEGESWHSRNLNLLTQHCDTRFYN